MNSVNCFWKAGYFKPNETTDEPLTKMQEHNLIAWLIFQLTIFQKKIVAEKQDMQMTEIKSNLIQVDTVSNA